jgi:hypothetical protein
MSAPNKRLRGIRPNVRFRPLTQNVGGAVTNRAERFMTPSQAVSIENMHAESEGSWTARNIGYTNKNSSVYESGATFQGLHWYTLPTGSDMLLGAINSKIISINPSSYAATVVDSTTGFTTSSEVDFQTYGSSVYYCDGTAATPRKYNGTVSAASSGWPAFSTFTTPKYVEEHNGRLVYANLSGNPAQLVMSAEGNGEDFTSTPSVATDPVSIQIGPGDGQAITGMRSVFIPQTNDTFLAVSKERSLYVITGYSALASDSDYFTVVKVNGTYGAVNNKSMVQVGNDLLMLGELPGGGFGIISYTTSLQSGTLQPSILGSDQIKTILNSINRSAAAKTYAVHFPSRREVVFGVPLGASTSVNYWVVYKYPGAQDETPKWSVRTAIIHPCGLVFQDKILFGTSTGYLSQWFASSTYNGTGINYVYEYPYTSFEAEGQHKRIPTAFAHFKTSVNQTVSIQSSWLGGGNNDDKTVSLSLSATSGDSTYGTAVYGSGVYAGSVEKKRQFKVYGNGERVKFKLTGTTTTSGGPEFLGLTTFVEYGGPSHHFN